MGKYRKKPVVIEAVQFIGTPTNIASIGMFMNNKNLQIASDYSELIITTLEGNHKALKGDWIIKGVKGEFYPCKPDIFEATYEPIEEL